MVVGIGHTTNGALKVYAEKPDFGVLRLSLQRGGYVPVRCTAGNSFWLARCCLRHACFRCGLYHRFDFRLLFADLESPAGSRPRPPCELAEGHSHERFVGRFGRPRKSCRSERDLAPIALFVYNRPQHTRETVESLGRMSSPPEVTCLYFPMPRKMRAAPLLFEQVRKFLNDIDGFRSITIIERNKNFGLGNSIVAGVTQLCDEFGSVIALEDDLLTTPDFLTFMNQGLRQYEGNPRTFSLSGFNFAVNARGLSV